MKIHIKILKIFKYFIILKVAENLIFYATQLRIIFVSMKNVKIPAFFVKFHGIC